MVKARLRNLLPLLVILLLSFFTWRPLLSAGFFTMHDDQQLARLFELDKSLKAGQFPVRWVPDLGFGLGYPLFNFYPPLTYYLGELSHVTLQTGFIDSTKVVWFLAFVGSAVSMYFLSREFFGKAGGVVSALFYLYAPYHAVDAYVRGAQAELFSFVWLPLVLLFSYKSLKEKSLKWSVWTGIVLALLMVTHNLVFLPFLGLFTLWYLAMMLIFNRKSVFRSFIFYLLSFILSFGLTAFFWLPSLAEKQFTLVDSLLIKSLASYKIHFVCPSQLWDSPWGYGGSIAGCVDGLSFKIGKLHVVLSILALGVGLYLWRRNQKISLIILSSLFSLLFSLFMTTNYSRFIWDLIPPLWYLQFPWRFLEFVVLFASFLAGSLVLAIPGRKLQLVFAALAISLLLYPNIKLFTPQTYLPRATDQELTSNRELKWRVSSTSFEYLPKGIATALTKEGAVWVAIDQKFVEEERAKSVVTTGDFSFDFGKFSPAGFSFSGRSQKGATIQVQITNFPGWTVWLDGQSTKILDNNKYKLITIQLPPGSHQVIGKFKNTPVRTLGNIISIMFILATGIYLAYGYKRSQI